MNGLINVYKEKGYTSHDVVAKLRGILRQKKIGHTGTLDPDAEGVLPICIGNATKICDFLTEKNKTYEAVLLLGITTDTQDITGTILETNKVYLSKEEIEIAIKHFIGEYNQVPPMYSALKVNGKKLYELAREGKVIERQPRKVIIYNITILSMNEDHSEIKIRVNCSKGTYIRTLCHDIGNLLHTGGCMKQLLRTKVGKFELKDSLTLAQIEQLMRNKQIDCVIIQVDTVFSDYSKVVVDQCYCNLVYNGNMFKDSQLKEKIEIADLDKVRVYDYENRFIGVYEYNKKQEQYRPVKMFL